MLTCYLDDSNNDKGPVASIAGYVSIKPAWDAFEREIEPFLNDRGIDVLHAKDFHHKRGPFKGWDWVKQRDFVEGLYSIAALYVGAGVSASVSKSDFNEILRKEKAFQSMSPLGFAFGTAVFAVLLKLDIPDEGFPVSFLVESGHKNNPNIEKYFDWLRKNKRFPDGVFGSLNFIKKSDCRAIQLADFLAFHGRRLAEVWHNTGYPKSLPDDPIMKIVTGNIYHRFERLRGGIVEGEEFNNSFGLFFAPTQGLR